MPSAEDTLKMLTAGDTMHVNVKFKSHTPLYRTPLIVLTNNHVFKNKAFNERLIKHSWQSAPFLAEYDKKPHPFVWPALLRKYDIVSFNEDDYNDMMEGNYIYEDDDNQSE